MIVRLPFFLGAILALTLASCGKSSSTALGDDAVRYQAEDYQELDNFAVEYKGKLYVENAAPYRDIMGDLMADAWATDINGNGVEMTGLEISNCYAREIRWDIRDNADSLLLYLESARLVLNNRWEEGSSVVLGEMILVDVANEEVLFTPVEEDITEWLETNRPDELYFEYTFRDVWSLQAPLLVRYEILFGYEYEYEESEP